jgi:hypothetical protein
MTSPKHVVADPEAATQSIGKGERAAYVATATIIGKGIERGKALDSCASFEKDQRLLD